MATIRKVTRVSNPKRRYRRTKGVRNAKGRFIRITKTRNRRHTRTRNTRAKARTKAPAIHRYNAKALKNELKRRGLKVNPTRRKGVKRAHRRHTRRKQNPVLIELGALSALNPKRRKNVAKKASRKRRRRTTRNPRRHAVAKVTHKRRRRYTRRRRATNPVARRTHRRRRMNVHRRRRHSNVRRNPTLFGRSGGKDLLMMVGGGLVGVAATKYLPTLLPSSITSGLGGGAIMSVAIMGAGAFAAGWLARRFVGGPFGDAVLFGGLMQTGSALLTAFAPSALASRLALSGVGDIVPGMYVVPQNPIKDYRPPAPPDMTNSGMGNLRRFGTFR
jgi:hypothetical protein